MQWGSPCIIWRVKCLAELMKQGRAPYQSEGMIKGTTEEMAGAAHGYMAYAGKYDLNEEERTLIHHIEVKMNPTWLGQQPTNSFN